MSRQLTDRARRMVDSALDRVFNEPFDIHSEDDFERVMTEHHLAMSFATAGALAGFVERALPIAKLSTKAGKKVPVPAIKYTLVAIPIAMQLGSSVRRGIREIQVIASYLIHRLREAGVDPRRGLVTALALSIALDPERRPDVGLTPGRAGAGLARQWVVRSMGKQSAKSLSRRARAEIAAVDRLDFRAVSKEWESRPV
ncbi:MAG: hypothetical protein WD271_11915 [Acidimicrobiia bacterium]